eukprot:3092075-Rhodomonas_salina.1
MLRVLRKGRHSPAMTAPHIPKMNGTVSQSMLKSRPRRSVVCALWEAFGPRRTVISALMMAGSAIIMLGTAVASVDVLGPWCVDDPWFA